MSELLLAFALGNAAILTNACLLPLYPGLIAFLAGNAGNERVQQGVAVLGVLVLAGVLTMMTLIGGVLALLSARFDQLLPVLLPLLYALVIVLGAVMLAGLNPFARLQTTQAPLLKNPYISAYVYGLFFGPMTLPCTGPIILSAFTLGSGIGDVAFGLAYFFVFGLGFGWPLVVLPLLALPFQRQIVRWLAGRHAMLTRTSGVLLMAVGVFGIITEILPQLWTGFYLDFWQQLIFWAIAAVIALAVAYISQPASDKTKVTT